MLIEHLKRQIKTIHTFVFQQYDLYEADLESLMSRLCFTHDNRQARENPVHLDAGFFTAILSAWEDEIVAGGDVDILDWTVPIRGYDVFVPYNKVNIDRPNSVASLERIFAQGGPVLRKIDQLQAKLAMNVFRTNPLSVTGQNFFSNAHPRPANQGMFDNILEPDWVDPAAPTEAEVKDFLDDVDNRLVEIATVDSEVVDIDKLSARKLVIVHNTTHQAVFKRVRDKRSFNDDENEHRGTFALLRDAKPTAGQENYIEVVADTPGGSRPVIRVLDQDPMPEAWETDAVRNGYVATGMKSMFGFVPGDPSTTVQARPV